MARVEFTLSLRWPIPAERVWAALSDWEGHGAWIPATTVRILRGDGGVGTDFVARTGLGPAAFDDCMTVVEFDAPSMRAVVEKTGPVLIGTAGFRIDTTGDGCTLHWFETIEVPHLPPVLSGVAACVGQVLFRQSLRKLRKRLTMSR